MLYGLPLMLVVLCPCVGFVCDVLCGAACVVLMVCVVVCLFKSESAVSL